MSKIKIPVYAEKGGDEDWRAFVPDTSVIKETEIESEDIVKISQNIVSIIYFANNDCIASPLKKWRNK